MARLLGPDGLGLLIQASPIIAFTAVTTVIGAWFNYLRTRTRERERTARLKAAIEGAPPERRSEIIESCGRLEASGPGDRSWAPRALPMPRRMQPLCGARRRQGA